MNETEINSLCPKKKIRGIGGDVFGSSPILFHSASRMSFVSDALRRVLSRSITKMTIFAFSIPLAAIALFYLGHLVSRTPSLIFVDFRCSGSRFFQIRMIGLTPPQFFDSTRNDSISQSSLNFLSELFGMPCQSVFHGPVASDILCFVWGSSGMGLIALVLFGARVFFKIFTSNHEKIT